MSSKTDIETKLKTVEKIKEADLQKKTSEAIKKQAEEMNKMFNDTLSSLAQPLYDIIKQFKPVPPKLRSIVDVQGASNGLYASMGEFQKSRQAFMEKVMIEQEVPITVEDYYAAPELYPDLEELEYYTYEITEQDCADSGYTKIIQTVDPQWMTKLIEAFPKPEERDIVAQQMEKLINTSIKTAWEAVKPAVKTIGSIVPIDPINTGIDAVINSLDGVVKIASETIPEEKLNEMIAKKEASKAKLKAQAKENVKAVKNLGKGISDKVEKTEEYAKNAVSSIGAGVKDGITDSFKNLKAPKLPDEVQSVLQEMKDAVIFVKDNISNIYIVLILKMIDQIVGCFKKILDVLGVPEIPNPLGQIPQIASDAYSVFMFVMGLPMSLISCIESILVRKWKMIQVCQTPVLPEPISEFVSLPATADDISYPIDKATEKINEVSDKIKNI